MAVKLEIIYYLLEIFYKPTKLKARKGQMNNFSSAVAIKSQRA
jgi:hypothetical protein